MKMNINNACQKTGATLTAVAHWKEKLMHKSIKVGQHVVTFPVREFIRK